MADPAAVTDETVKEAQKKLRSTFGAGAQFDDDVVRELLIMNGGDVKQVISFMQLPAGAPEPPQANADGTPKDYFKAPKGLDKHKSVELARAARAPKVSAQMKSLFLSDSAASLHVEAQLSQYPDYVSVLLLLFKHHLEMSTAIKGRVLAVCLARRDWELTQYLLNGQNEAFGLPEVLRACVILDTPRELRALERKLARLTRAGRVKPTTTGAITLKMNELRTEGVHTIDRPGIRMSLTSGLSRRIREWVQQIPPDRLTFYALSLPKEPWRALADMVHLKPSDFQLPWFLPVVFDAPPPPDTVIARCADLTPETCAALVATTDVPYSYLRRQIPPGSLLPATRRRVAQYETLKTIVWYYEELGCPEVNEIIVERLRAGEVPELSYGKLMERLLLFRRERVPFLDAMMPAAERALRSMRLPLDPPVVVLGDASYSMDVAIRTATIIASVLSYMANADLKFFNNECFNPPRVPRTIEEVLDVASTVQADGLTAPACALWGYYERHEVVKVFVVVTDEIENIPYRDYFFAQLFVKYYNEVHPAKLVFVSFLEAGQQTGRMVQALQSFGITPMQFRLDQTRPDLTKLTTLIGVLAAESAFFQTQTEDIASSLKAGGLRSTVVALAGEPAPSESPTARRNEVMREAQKLRDEENSCCVCMAKPKDTALLDCGHMCACSDCSEGLRDCPICRSPVVRRVRIFR